ncbi:MAG: glycosyltransferase [Anaerolineae bacterium]|nr:glycosyltransferase [Anaerolineae bacterium]
MTDRRGLVCFLIPAHNEAGSIAETVRRLVGLAGPVFVVADHCSDATAQLAAEAGARVYERRDGPAGKGAALSWFAEAARDELSGVDLIVVLDADSRLAESFVPRMKEALLGGAGAAQGFVYPEGARQSAASALAAYSELLSQRIGDNIRARLGWSVPLRGTGMAFRPSILRMAVESLRTRTEDIEMSLRLAVHGVPVRFVPGAMVYDPKPAAASLASRQRARWLQGQWEVWRAYWRDILRLALRGGPNAWSLLWALLAKPKALLTASKVLVLIGALLMPGTLCFRAPLLAAAVLTVVIDALYYVCGLAVVHDRRLYARALLLSPLYIAVWVRSIVLAGLSRQAWLRARD